jgi:hypothetical protein
LLWIGYQLLIIATIGKGAAYFLKLERTKEGLIISVEQLLQRRPKTISILGSSWWDGFESGSQFQNSDPHSYG